MQPHGERCVLLHVCPYRGMCVISAPAVHVVINSGVLAAVPIIPITRCVQPQNLIHLRIVEEAYAWITSVKVLQHANTKAVKYRPR